MASSLLLGLRFVAAALLASLIGLLWRHHRVSIGGRLAIGLCVGLMSYLGAQTWGRGGGFGPLWVLVAAANPALLWLLARSLFSDDAVSAGVNRAHVATAFSLTAVIQTFALLSFRDLGIGHPVTHVLDDLMPQFLSLGLVGLAFIETQRQTRGDLIQPRIQLRRFLIALIASYGLVTLLFEVAIGDAPPPWELELAHQVVLTALIGLGFGLVWRHGAVLFGDATPLALGSDVALLRAASTPPASQPVALDRASTDHNSSLEQSLRVRLTDWEQAGGFLEPGLTIGELATRLGTQEYVLRRFLNGVLGYRNFNDFVHRLRIGEACRRLLADGATDLSILKLSIDVGYSSLATFNRAFKAIVGVTPTEYRNGAQFRN